MLAMGGGMARALLDSSVTKQVIGFDMNSKLKEDFHKDAENANKAHSSTPPASQKDSIQPATEFVVLALVNETQCDQVCFAGADALKEILPKGSCVIMTSTVTATWARKAAPLFTEAGILFVDCPMSGGPVKAREGTLTMMASADDASLSKAKPIIEAMGKDVHIIEGGPGMGSTVKMVHQLLAGVHICAAAEALALAAKAGIDVHQVRICEYL